LLLAVLVATGGCYEYQAVRPADAVMDTRVRATVSSEQATELAPVLRDVTPTVQGRLVERDSDSILLEVPLYGATPGVSTAPVHNRVRIPMGDLVSLESRKISRWKTAVALGAVVAAVAGGYTAVTGAENIDGKQKSGTNNNIISIFSLPFTVFR
jgi:hypothetical protein